VSKLHALSVRLSAALFLATGLSSCAVRGDAPAEPAPPLAGTEKAGPKCYLSSPLVGEQAWQPDYLDETECYRTRICDEAEDGENTGLCFKWALGPDEPPLPWSERLANPELGASIPPPEDLYEGFGEMTSESCFEDCQPVPMRLTNATPIYLQPDTRSELIGTVPATECVGRKSYKLLSTPTRGVVIESGYGYSAGDVIYSLAYQGEGAYLAWWRGGYTSAEYDYPKVQWEETEEPADPREGYWQEFVRADGTSGWARDADYTDYGNCAIAQD
jgi:hypothetical protein